MVNLPNFYPSQLHPLGVRISQSLSYLIAHLFYKINFKIAPTSLERFKKIEDHRIVLLANHPTFDDGLVMFLLSSRLGELFNYLVAYESFRGLVGKILQLIGAYSVQRGLADRRSIEYTLNLLKKPKSRLVVFPEGGCSFQNDTVMPFRSGAIQLSFKAYSELVKIEAIAPDFYLLPVSIKYVYTGSVQGVIEKTLRKLEKHYQIDHPASDRYLRLREIAATVLLNLEKEYGLIHNKAFNSDWNQRIETLKEHILAICAQKVNITFAPDIPVRERVYKIQSLSESKFIEEATIRLLNFDAIYDGYVAAYPTPERFMDTLIRLEREAFDIDQPPAKTHRQALVYLGEPINLKDYLESYAQNRAETIEILTQKTRHLVQQNLGKFQGYGGYD
ncbi:1-acyl-sn-glycerol-3-phosphate acyltransferase [Gloeocapsa sp. PCC 73106]|uniref:1-acyl-sn-glycerol-3-phosphate acyltransferase n=1 Tax=Gloeocapsa sp. PCC 73106 TaxID=102232 RepID=UPI0002AC2194|nr:1-acyl-sn-glycerol-3-phosphate acyltransferase [Gloeocapsa sp. PCC 73106]ELR97905.1 1-acyl-sn-glycerol-3-phosphate acyltransferase [Gloeocapsa sp. PCC 73106]